MIKINKGTSEIAGTYPILMAEFSTLVRTLHDKILIENMGKTPEKAREEILRAVDIGLQDFEESRAEAIEKLHEHPELILDILKELFAGKGDE